MLLLSNFRNQEHYHYQASGSYGLVGGVISRTRTSRKRTASPLLITEDEGPERIDARKRQKPALVRLGEDSNFDSNPRERD